MTHIRVTSAGPAERLGAAMIPAPARPAQAYQSRGIIFGSPGTMRVPAPYPSAVPQERVPLAQGNHDSRSSDAPAYWTPGIYYELPGPNGYEHAPVSVFSDNQMPVPALTPSGLPAVVMGRPRLGGQRQVRQPVAVPSFPDDRDHGRRRPRFSEKGKRRRQGRRLDT